jgi:hypothetical protein
MDAVRSFEEEARKLHRTLVRTSLNVEKLLEHMGLPKATEAEVDRALNAE